MATKEEVRAKQVEEAKKRIDELCAELLKKDAQITELTNYMNAKLGRNPTASELRGAVEAIGDLGVLDGTDGKVVTPPPKGG